jgi:hypothetical protein
MTPIYAFHLMGIKLKLLTLSPKARWKTRVFVSVARRVLTPVAYIGGGAALLLSLASGGPYSDVHSRRQFSWILTRAFRVGGGLAVALLRTANGQMTLEQFREYLEDPLSRRSQSSIRRAPGWRLHRMVAWVYKPRTFEEVLEPVLSDLQEEYFEALRQGARGKAQWVRVRGYCAFWTHVGLLVPGTLFRALVTLWKMF